MTLTLELQVPDEPLVRADPVPVTVMLTNDSAAPIVVNRRMAPGYVDSDSREVYFDIDGDYGRNKYERNPPTPDDYVPLAPATRISAQIDLLAWYRLRAAGTYRVRAHYRCDEEPADPPAGVFRGVVDSDPVTIRVE